jgi:hypothetical protein
MAKTLKKHAASKPDAAHASGNGSQPKPGGRPLARNKPHMDRFARHRPNYQKALWAIGKRGASFLRWLEGKCGCFLPYRLSESRNDELFETIRQMGRDENVTTALIIGAFSGGYSTEALLTGLSENQTKARVFCIVGSEVTSPWKYKEHRANLRVAWRDVSFFGQSGNDQHLKKVIGQLKEDNNIDVFDVLLINSSQMHKSGDGDGAVIKSLCDARLVVLEELNSVWGLRNYNALVKDANYSGVSYNPDLRDGYAVFARLAKDEVNDNAPELVCAK